MAGNAAFRALLEAGDVEGLRRYYAAHMAHLPQPKTNAEAEIVMHLARTASASVAFKHRAYSHAWLCERNLPSQLPDMLKPAAERLHPKVVEGVMVSVNFRNELLKPAAKLVRDAINEAIEDCYAEGDTDPVLVRQRMDAAKAAEMKALFGRLT